jgi:predicted GTPase
VQLDPQHTATHMLPCEMISRPFACTPLCAIPTVMDQTVADSFRLGFGEPVALSATTGEGLSDLFVALQPQLDRIRHRLLTEAGVDPDSVNLTRSTRTPRLQDSSTAATVGSSTHEDQGSVSELEPSSLPDTAQGRGSSAAGQSCVSSQRDIEEADGSSSAIKMAVMGLPNAVSVTHHESARPW